MSRKKVNLDKMIQTIEADAGETIPGLKQALQEAQEGLGRIHTPEQILVRQAREKTGMTQAEFADRIQTPVATLRDWEQGRFSPPGGVLCLFHLILKHPELSRELGPAT